MKTREEALAYALLAACAGRGEQKGFFVDL